MGIGARAIKYQEKAEASEKAAREAHLDYDRVVKTAFDNNVVSKVELNGLMRENPGNIAENLYVLCRKKMREVLEQAGYKVLPDEPDPKPRPLTAVEREEQWLESEMRDVFKGK